MGEQIDVEEVRYEGLTLMFPKELFDNGRPPRPADVDYITVRQLFGDLAAYNALRSRLGLGQWPEAKVLMGGINPFSKETWNATLQAVMWRADKKEAMRLELEAKAARTPAQDEVDEVVE